MTRFHRHVTTLALFALSAALVGAFVGPAGAGSRNTPDNEILVVTANIEEAYTMGTNDLANHFEIDNFAQRVKDVVPKVPDVLLLQEVNRETSLLAARRLSARLNQRFVVGVRPIANTTLEYSDRQVHTETAILLNARTMATEHKGGYFAAKYPSSAAPPGQRVQVRRQAYMLARERATGLKVPIVSLHYAMESSFRTASLSNDWRGKWSAQLKGLLNRKYNADSNRRAPMIGGDFNAGRCYRGDFSNCTVAKWWKTMTSRPHKYLEAGREHLVPYGVDAIFIQGTAVNAGWDEHGDFSESDRQRFYSDHRLRWATVSPTNT